MKKRHIVALLFFLCFFGVAIRAMELFPKENISPKELPLKDRIILSLKEGKASIIDNISGGNKEEEIKEEEVVVVAINTSDDNNIIVEKIIVPTQEIIHTTKENTIEKIEKIIETITAPVKDTTNALAKQLISWLLSLLSPEEIREMLKNEFNVDICI